MLIIIIIIIIINFYLWSFQLLARLYVVQPDPSFPICPGFSPRKKNITSGKKKDITNLKSD